MQRSTPATLQPATCIQPRVPRLRPAVPRRSPPKQLKDPPPEKYSIEWYLERAKETERSKAAPDATRARLACARAARRLGHSSGSRLWAAPCTAGGCGGCRSQPERIEPTGSLSCAAVSVAHVKGSRAHVAPLHLQAGGSVAALALLTAVSAAAFVLF